MVSNHSTWTRLGVAKREAIFNICNELRWGNSVPMCSIGNGGIGFELIQFSDQTFIQDLEEDLTSWEFLGEVEPSEEFSVHIAHNPDQYCCVGFRDPEGCIYEFLLSLE